jgi:hypothetical protein
MQVTGDFPRGGRARTFARVTALRREGEFSLRGERFDNNKI